MPSSENCSVHGFVLEADRNQRPTLHPDRDLNHEQDHDLDHARCLNHAHENPVRDTL
jgi:hypothetical protein